MAELKEELQKAFSHILGEELKGNFDSAAEVVAAFNDKMDIKKGIKKTEFEELK